MTAALNKGELFASFDVDAFEIPHGRDELWRFTPLKRLRGLHDGTAVANGTATVTVSEHDGVRTDTLRRGDERLGQGGVPADRVAAQAFSSFNAATLVTVGRDTQVADPINITVTGPGQGATAYGHLQIRVEELGEAVVVIDTGAAEPTPTTPNSSSATPPGSPSSGSRTGPTTPCRSAPTTPASARTRYCGTSPSPWVARWCG